MNLELNSQLMQQIERCQFYNVKKNRPCNMEVYKTGGQYCVFHGQQDIDWIECPLDPSHKVKKVKMDKHLKICNKKKLDEELKQNPFFKEKINLEEDAQQKKMKLQTLSKEQFNELIEMIPQAFQKAIAIYQEYLGKIGEQTENCYSYILDENVEEAPQKISDKEKDLQQVELLTQIMDQYNLINKDMAYIEYGAGKGRFSHQIAEKLKEKDNSMAIHVLIEREPRKLKYDRFHRDNKYFIRCKMDIRDFNLKILEQQLKEQGYDKEIQYVGVCKHMCGGASDLTLTSLLTQERFPVGMTIATCCHHLCDKNTYKNLAFMNQINVPEHLIELLFQTSSWYVSGSINQQKKVKTENEISSDQRKTLGKMAKRIIDIGRVLYIHQITQLKVILKKYCEQLLSPENFIILLYK
ncbi:unnamed protein product [Paramecium pentaurelia]|uniref:tRNA:m(4)X modification enzyme TRM13 n=1 Tax=Paramecium pentaurelia TaxID=43138 RepID=A0A8S1U6U2_9CILI|nr:unnamed protein product [Paramecium pentaurelia]